MTAMTRPTTTKAADIRLLAINPNGNREVTALVERVGREAARPTTHIVALNPEGSPRSIETPEDRKKAEPLAIDLLARSPGYDAYVMACFDDIAIAAGRSFLGAPIVCAAEAAISLARLHALRFTIITTVETMVPGILSLVKSLGVEDRCTVRATGIGVAEATGAGQEIGSRIDAEIRAAQAVDGAGAIILGSGGLAGRAPELRRRHGLPVIDSIDAAIAMADLAARIGAKHHEDA
ncbi:aspartate/glutamate racemase family protein [Amaricoccus macauensis]|uniref:aspartate/glutamate racemase family protein n=1 Tax=Amaricoccus macauensis TaxID=57001 RepID=UPI003C7B3602